jgi:ABC-type branched-subunit amino acid transport system ATPase component
MGLGFVPQTKDVFDTLTVTENLEMGGYLLTKPQLAARIDKVMSTFPALANMRSRTASKLSGGERKMLAVARVLMVEPTVLVLDEPTSNLSPELSRSVLRDQVRRLADSGTAVLLVEQKAFEALGVSDWAYILVAGRVEIAGAASEILGRPDIREVFLGQSGTDSPAAQSPPGQAARDLNSPTHPTLGREP